MFKNRKMYFNINIDRTSTDLFDSKIDITLSELFLAIKKKECDYHIIITDQNGIIDEDLNEIVRQFIKMSLKGEVIGIPKLTTVVTFTGCVKDFICRLIAAIIKYETGDYYRDDTNLMDLIAPKSTRSVEYLFKIDLPEKIISDDDIEEYIALGPDYLISPKLSPSTIYEYIVPTFFIFLSEYQGFDDPELNCLDQYKIGAH